MSQIAKGIKHSEHENIAINGGFDLWQRGLDTGNITVSNIMADRFTTLYGNMGAIPYRTLRSTGADVPTLDDLVGYSNVANPYCMNIVSQGIRVPTGDDIFGFGYRMEGLDAMKLYGDYFSVSFMAKTERAGIYSLNCFSEDVNGDRKAYITEVNIPVANVWTIVHKVIPMFVEEAFLADPRTDNLRALSVELQLAVGASRQTSNLDQWQNSFFGPNFGSFGSVNQTNDFFDAPNNTFRISHFQITPGTSLKPWKRAGANFADEVAKAQRYFEKSYNIDTSLGTVTSVGREFMVSTTSFGEFDRSFGFRTTKRDTPSMQEYDESGVSGVLDFVNVGARGFGINDSGSAAGNANFHWAAECEI